jgi:hypothetical protein
MAPAYAVKSISWSGSTGGDDRHSSRMHPMIEHNGKGRTWHGTIEDKRKGNGHGKGHGKGHGPMIHGGWNVNGSHPK